MELREVDSEDSDGETADEEHCSDDNDNIVVVDDESNDSTDSESEEEIPPVRKRMKLLDKHPILAVSPTVKATCRRHDTHASCSSKEVINNTAEVTSVGHIGDGNVLESGKDGTIWIKLHGEEPKVRKLSQNVLKHIPGPTREAKARILTPFDAFKCIVDITMITWLVSYTELEATR